MWITLPHFLILLSSMVIANGWLRNHGSVEFSETLKMDPPRDGRAAAPEWHCSPFLPVGKSCWSLKPFVSWAPHTNNSRFSALKQRSMEKEFSKWLWIRNRVQILWYPKRFFFPVSHSRGSFYKRSVNSFFPLCFLIIQPIGLSVLRSAYLSHFDIQN